MAVQHWVHRLTNHLWYEKSGALPVLIPFGKAYAHGVDLVHEAYRSGRIATRGLPVPVVVVGNITVGGTGKTPLTIWIARMLKAQGLRPGIISRGYGGMTPRRPLLVDINTSPRLAGDEPVMMAKQTACPVAIFPKRVDAGEALLSRFQIDVLIADDGLQHHELERDVEIAVVDGSRGFGNGHLLPAGPLREPVERLDRVDFIVSNGGDGTDGIPMQLKSGLLTNLRQHCMKRSMDAFKGQRVHAIAGIGNPGRFFNTLKASGLDIVTHPFPDHHPYSAKDLAFAGDDPIIMTEKDAVKCKAFARENDWYLPVEAVLPSTFGSELLTRLREKFAART
jgi:tetraacyldisaccharide 4'-kinase